MDLAAVARVIAVVCIGLLAGIFVGYRAGPYHALQELSASTFVQFQRVVHIHYVRFMPSLILSALLAALAWLWSLRSEPMSLPFLLVGVSVVAIAIIAGLTRAISIPLNRQLMGWDAANPPSDLKDRWRPWDRVNSIRAALATGVLAIETIALILDTSRAGP